MNSADEDLDIASPEGPRQGVKSIILHLYFSFECSGGTLSYV